MSNTHGQETSIGSLINPPIQSQTLITKEQQPTLAMLDPTASTEKTPRHKPRQRAETEEAKERRRQKNARKRKAKKERARKRKQEAVAGITQEVEQNHCTLVDLVKNMQLSESG